MAGKAEEQSKSNKALIIVFCVVIVVLLSVIGILVYSNFKKSTSSNEVEKPIRAIVGDEDDAEKVVEEVISEALESDTGAGAYYTATMNSTWNFPDGKSESTNAYVENDPENTNDVYFDVTLKDTGELIYASPIIPLGKSLRNFKLDKELEVGTYDCVVTYHLVDENQETISTIAFNIVVIIEN